KNVAGCPGNSWPLIAVPASLVATLFENSFRRNVARNLVSIGNSPRTIRPEFLLQPNGVVDTHFASQGHDGEVLPEPPDLNWQGNLGGQLSCVHLRQYVVRVPLPVAIWARR